MRLYYARILDTTRNRFYGQHFRAESLHLAEHAVRQHCVEKHLVDVSYRVREVPMRRPGWHYLLVGIAFILLILTFLRLVTLIFNP